MGLGKNCRQGVRDRGKPPGPRALPVDSTQRPWLVKSEQCLGRGLIESSTMPSLIRCVVMAPVSLPFVGEELGGGVGDLCGGAEPIVGRPGVPHGGCHWSSVGR